MSVDRAMVNTVCRKITETVNSQQEGVFEEEAFGGKPAMYQRYKHDHKLRIAVMTELKKGDSVNWVLMKNIKGDHDVFFYPAAMKGPIKLPDLWMISEQVGEKCRKCKTTKSLDSFRKTPTDISKICIECEDEQARINEERIKKIALLNTPSQCVSCRETKPATMFKSDGDVRREKCISCERSERKASNRKFCSGCKKDKSKTDFFKNSSKSDGLGSYCKTCQAERRNKSLKSKQRNEVVTGEREMTAPSPAKLSAEMIRKQAEDLLKQAEEMERSGNFEERLKEAKAIQLDVARSTVTLQRLFSESMDALDVLEKANEALRKVCGGN